MFFLPLFDNNPTMARPFVTGHYGLMRVWVYLAESLDYRTAHNIVYQLGFIPAFFYPS